MKDKSMFGGILATISALMGIFGFFYLFMQWYQIGMGAESAEPGCEILLKYIHPLLTDVGLFAGILFAVSAYGFFTKKDWAFFLSVVGIVLALLASWFINVPYMAASLPPVYFPLFWPYLLIYFLLLRGLGGISVVFSVINALTLSPALASILLKPPSGKKSFLQPFYDGFNKVFGRFTDGYVGFTGILVRKAFRSAVLVLVFTVVAGLLARSIPGGFVPDEDNGYFLANVMLPDASSLERTDAVARRVEEIIGKAKGVEYVTTVTGFSLITGAYASNNAFLFVSLKPWEERAAKEEHAFALMESLNAQLRREVPEALSVTFGPPPIIGLGSGSGFTMMLQDRSGGSPEFLAENAQKFLAAARKRPEIGNALTFYRATVPQIYADIDRSKVLKTGAPLSDVNTTLGALLGSSYVNDFNRFGRVTL